MTIPDNFRLPAAAAQKPNLEAGDEGIAFLRTLGVELAYIQDVSGRYRSFYWRDAENASSQKKPLAVFQPIDPVAYLHEIRHILDRQIPHVMTCGFESDSRVWLFDLSMTPLPIGDGDAACLLVIGNRSRPSRLSTATHSDVLPLSSGKSLRDPNSFMSRVSYPKLLTQIARKIRQTLDLETIWQQTASGLGAVLNIDRCYVYAYSPGSNIVRLVAEHNLTDRAELIERELKLSELPELRQAVTDLEPAIVEAPSSSDTSRSQLLVATRHQGQANGAIALERSTPCQPHCDANTETWHPTEVEIVEELADQIGTAIAHATLYRELEIARQQAEEVSRLKSDFLANTSHELRTPLNGMMGFLKLILDGMADDPEEQMEFIQEAYRSAVHLLSIINDILDIAKIEAGKMQLDLEPVNLEEILAHLKDFVQAQIQQKQLYFQIQMPDTEDSIVVYSNYQRLLQVLLNLVGNAIKFTHEGGITITADITEREVVVNDRHLSGLVKLQVADTGIGVSLEKQDKLFQTFSQVDGSRTRQYGGTGLGLVISQKLVEAMGGEVHFYSMGEGLGSTVTFTVPLFQEPVMISTSEILDALDTILEDSGSESADEIV